MRLVTYDVYRVGTLEVILSGEREGSKALRSLDQGSKSGLNGRGTCAI